MSQFIPLPDELLRKVYGYILPIFEYAKYVRNIEGYNDTLLEMNFVCEDYQELMFDGGSVRKLENIEQLSAYTALQMEYLVDIRRFLDDNPKSVRPGRRGDLTEHQYRQAFDASMTDLNIERFERNLKIRRGIWMYPDERRELLLFHDILEILLNGTTRDLIYSCIVNGLKGFKSKLQRYLKRYYNNSMIYNHRIIQFINYEYAHIDSDVVLRRKLVRKLMKL